MLDFLFDFLITDPLVRRQRKLARIQKKILEESEKRQECIRRGLELTKEYEALRLECKKLKKTGYPK